MKLLKHFIWETYFVQYAYFRSETATDPVWKTFKRFPVEPTVEYVQSLEQAYLDGDFDLRDVLIEIINLQYEIQDLKESGLISNYLEHKIDLEIIKLSNQIGIKL